eukprot:363455-Chlamydomonas_euryale.AAC.14
MHDSTGAGAASQQQVRQPPAAKTLWKHSKAHRSPALHVCGGGGVLVFCMDKWRTHGEGWGLHRLHTSLVHSIE